MVGTGRPIEEVQVGPANATRFDGNDHLTMLSRGLGNVPGPTVVDDGDVLLTIEVTNIGSERLWSLYLYLYLYLDGVGGVACPDRDLAVGELVVCEQSVASSSDYTAEATATAWPDDGPSVSAASLISFTPASGDELENLALGKQASQASSRQWELGTPAGLAVDGNRDGDLDGGSVAMTYRVTEAWWEVDLGGIADINRIVLWNRTDCCSQRLRNVHVFVSDVEFELEDIAGTRTQPDVSEYLVAGPAGRKTVVRAGRPGRFVRVQLGYKDAVLALAEVEVKGTMGAPAPAALPAPEITFDLLVDGKHADDPPGPRLVPGEPLTFTYRVTNVGQVAINHVSVNHDGIGRIECDPGRIEPGRRADCTLVEVAQAGPYAAGATVRATSDDGSEARARDLVHYRGGVVAPPGIVLTASAQGEDADVGPGPLVQLGEPITFDYSVTNTGPTVLYGLSVYHDGVGTVPCRPRQLAPGAEAVCRLDSSALHGLIEAEVSASMWDAAGTRVDAVDPVVYTGTTPGPQSAISIRLSVNGEEVAGTPGPTVPLGTTALLEVDVINVGVVDLWGLWGLTRAVGVLDCPVRYLPPGQTVRCSVSTPAAVGAWSSRVDMAAYDATGPRSPRGTISSGTRRRSMARRCASITTSTASTATTRGDPACAKGT